MFQREIYPGDEEERRQMILSQHRSLLDTRCGLIANMANTCALLYFALENVNWVGFYFLRKDCLELGPFQGLPACTRLPLRQGVCAKAAELGEPVRVADVHAFEGHIACDSASKSELVIPLLQNGHVVGVMDLDSPLPDRFSEKDTALLREIAFSLMEAEEA